MKWHDTSRWKKHKNTAKTIENRTWRHLAAFQARLDAPLDRCFMSVSFVSSSVAMLKFSGLIGTKLLVGLIWCICSVIVGLLCLNTSFCDLLLDILRGYTGNSRKARTLHSPFLFFQSVGNRVCWKAMWWILLTSKVSEAWTELIIIYIATHPQRPVFPLGGRVGEKGRGLCRMSLGTWAQMARPVSPSRTSTIVCKHTTRG